MATETELKFNVTTPETFNELKNLTELDGFVIERIGLKVIVDRYMDTTDRHLFDAGFACRLRTPQHEEGQMIATLKSLTPARAGLHRRQEIEEPVPGDEPATWPDTGIKRVLSDIIQDAPLQGLFTIYQTRLKYHVLADQAPLMELSLDRVGGKPDQTDYLELELELLEAGTEAMLYEFAGALQARWPLHAEQRSKFERAYQAIYGEDNCMFDLTVHEQKTLEKVASGTNKNLARRANIILLSAEVGTVAEIATQVGFTARTVKQWQREFAEKRLDIFPGDALPGIGAETPAAAGADVAALETADAEATAPEVVDAEATAPETVDAEATAPEVVDAEAATTEVEPATTTRKSKKAKMAQSGKKKKARKKAKRKAKKNRNSLHPAKQIGLAATDSFAEAGRKVLKFHFAGMLAREAGTRLGEDIEELHDMRVATRRMRAAFSLFGSSYRQSAIKPLLDGLKATGRALGPVRDMDVFLEKLQAYRDSMDNTEQDEFQIFLNVWADKRARARRKLLGYLDSKKYRQFKRDFQSFVTTEGRGVKTIPQTVPPVPFQLRHIVPGLVYKAYDQVRAYETLLNNAPIETLHQLRISFKGLRYTLEFMEEVLGSGKELVISEVKAMQNHLGDLNDADVASALLRNFLAEWEDYQQHLPLTQRQRPTPIVSYLNAQINKRHDLLVTFPEAWERFNRPEIRETLARSIANL
jgi:CHAD domain-containing protein